MWLRLKNMIQTVFLFSLLSTCLMGADSSTIYTNTSFPQDYYLNAGQTYSQGGSPLTFKMITVDGQMGLFNSHERSILNAQTNSVSGLPAGLTWSVAVDNRNPVTNTLFLFGTIPANLAAGTYQVSIVARDAARPKNTAVQTINLHIAAVTAESPPYVIKTPALFGGGQGDAVIANIADNFAVLPGSSAVDSYQIVNPSALPPTTAPGITGIDGLGNFIGTTYAAAGMFYGVQVLAHNRAGWSDANNPLIVNFAID